MNKTTLLIILDGWGHSTATDFNAIHRAHTPNWDDFLQKKPHRLIQASGSCVGLPAGQMGNSEVGHMHLGAGRTIYQNLAQIHQDIADGMFQKNVSMQECLNSVKQRDKALHVIGLISPGGIHSHEEHIFALIKMARQRGLKKIYIHAILDGRDTAPKSALSSMHKLASVLHSATYPQHRIASVSGRFYAMDRDQRWPRIQQAYQAIADGVSDHYAASAAEAIQQAYQRGETDEFVQPCVITDQQTQTLHITSGDGIVFMNFRADRARQLSHALVDTDFPHFPRRLVCARDQLVTLTEYATGLTDHVIYPPKNITNNLGSFLSGIGKKQLRIAETEKYAHVTFFFNCGREEPDPGEERILIPSPQVRTYDLKPEMSACAITDELVRAIHSQKYDLIVCNYANGDMVGHTGNFEAAVQAAEAIDQCLGRINQAVQETGSQCLITADHGNLEQMLDQQTQQPLTAHTTEPVPLVYLGTQAIHFTDADGSLANVAPTLLDLMHLEKPSEMTAVSLIQYGNSMQHKI